MTAARGREKLWRKFILEAPEIKARMVELGADTADSNPDQFGRFVRDEIAKFRRIVKEAKIAVD